MDRVDLTCRKGAFLGTLLLIAWVTGACGPLLDTSGSGLSCGLLNISGDSGNGQILDQPHNVAQSFLVQGSSVTVSTVNLRLVAHSQNGVTRPSGALKLFIYSDASVTPNGRPTVPSGSALGPVNDFGTVDASVISLTQPTFYTFSLPSPITLTPGPYWVYVTSGVVSNPNLQVLWEQTSGDAYANGFPWYQGTVLSGFDLITQMGCGP